MERGVKKVRTELGTELRKVHCIGIIDRGEEKLFRGQPELEAVQKCANPASITSYTFCLIDLRPGTKGREQQNAKFDKKSHVDEEGTSTKRACRDERDSTVIEVRKEEASNLNSPRSPTRRVVLCGNFSLSAIGTLSTPRWLVSTREAAWKWVSHQSNARPISSRQ